MADEGSAGGDGDTTAQVRASGAASEAESGSAAVAQRQISGSSRRRGGRRKHGPPKSEHIHLNPPDSVVLIPKRSETGSVKFSASLSISNMSEHKIIFKIRTNKPHRYHVQPTAGGIIDSASAVTVRIVVRNEAADELQNELGQSAHMFKDKFQVQSMVMTPDMWTRLTAASQTSQAEEMGAMLEAARKANKVAIEKLGVTVAETERALQPVQETPREAPPPAASAPAPASVTQPAVPPVVSSVPQAAPQSQPIVDTDSLAKMREHYNNLLRHTLTTEAQHDEKLSRAKLELEAANRRYEDAMRRIKELESGGARRRNITKRGGAGESKDGTNAGDGSPGDGDGEDNVRVVRTGFPLWQLIIVAIVMFVVGTLMADRA